MANLNEIKVGQQVLVKIKAEGDYFGTVCLINAERTRIHLKDVVFCQHKLSGEKRFYLSDIQLIDVVSDVVPDVVSNVEAAESDTTLDDRITFDISAKENEAIQRLITNRWKIKTVGEEFDKALAEICQHELIGLNVGDVENGEITSIACTTPRRIYEFMNIKTIGAIDRLNILFESDAHTKVIYDASVFHCHGIKLMKLFDTSVVHKLLGVSSVNTTPRIAEHLNNEDSTVDQFQTFIGRTAILLKLHDFLTEQLLKNAYQSFNDNMNYCRNKDSFDAQLIYRNENSIVQRLNEIAPFKLNLGMDVDK